MLIVYHGTRRSLAEAIADRGFEPLDVVSQIDAVAESFGVDTDQVRNDLELHGRFAITDVRGGTVSVATNKWRAANWANRAPEATWESLWAVYRLRNPALGYEWITSEEGHLWVLGQQIADPPVVIEIEIPAGYLRFDANGRSAEGWLDADDDLYHQASFRLDAVAAPRLVRIESVATRIDPSLARFMSGMDLAAFREQVESGLWGQLHVGRQADSPWFAFDDIWTRLSDRRRADLRMVMEPPVRI